MTKSLLARIQSAPIAINKIAIFLHASVLSVAAAALLLGGAPAQARTAQAPGKAIPAPPVSQNCPTAEQPTPEQIAALRQQSHPDRGVLWEIRKGEQRAYLLGTIHLGKLEWLSPGPRTQQAIQGAPAIALELDPLDTSNTEQLGRFMKEDTDVQKLILRNNPQIGQRMDKLATQLCLPAEQFKQLGVVGKVMTLSMVDAVGAGYSPLFGVDLMLAATARQAKKPVVALETVQEQIAALGLGSNKLADSATPQDFDKVLGDIASGKSRDLLRQLAGYWQQGDLAAVDQLMRSCNCMDDLGMKSALLDDRNARMAERIPAHLDKYPNLLIAVGLLHMVGDNNLLQMLEKQGYTVRQLTGVGASSAP